MYGNFYNDTMTLQELQDLTSDNRTSVATLLQHALILASEIGDHDFAKWARLELEGYDKPDTLPAYRTIPGTITAVTDGYALPMATWVTDRAIRLPVCELEYYFLDDQKSDSQVAIKIDPRTIDVSEQPVATQRLFGRDLTWAIAFERTTIVRLFSAVKQRILNWTILQKSQENADTPALRRGQQHATPMTRKEVENWLLRYLDKHCAEPGPSGVITFARWTSNEPPANGHAFEFAMATMLDCEGLQGAFIRLVASSLKCNKAGLGEDFGGGAVAEAFAGSVVEKGHGV